MVSASSWILSMCRASGDIREIRIFLRIEFKNEVGNHEKRQQKNNSFTGKVPHWNSFGNFYWKGIQIPSINSYP
jgi:hypothetical protein